MHDLKLSVRNFELNRVRSRSLMYVLKASGVCSVGASHRDGLVSTCLVFCYRHGKTCMFDCPRCQ